MSQLQFILSFCFGSVIGSFLNVVILRLPAGQKITGRSHCQSCLKQLSGPDLVPVLSFVWLRGRCRYCRAKISWRYFIIEIICGLLFAVSWQYLKPVNPFGLLLLAKYWLSVAALIVVFAIDLEHYLILDEVLIWSSAGVLILNLMLDAAAHFNLLNIHGSFLSGLLGALVFFSFFFLIWLASSGKWLGFGDVKLAVLLGLVLGWPLVSVGLMLAVILGGLFSSILLIFTDKTLKSQIPFGTFLSLATVLTLFLGPILLSWYLSILGF